MVASNFNGQARYAVGDVFSERVGKARRLQLGKGDGDPEWLFCAVDNPRGRIRWVGREKNSADLAAT